MIRGLALATAAAVVAASGAASEAAARNVTKLTEPAYEAFLADAAAGERWVLLDFYAPWCGHCKRLNPILDAFAAATPGVSVAKVDATAETALAKAHDVDGYPTLRFRKVGGDGFRDYKGGRTGEALALLAARLAGPEIAALAGGADLAALAAPAPGVAFVASLPLAPALEAAFDAVARKTFHAASFGTITGGGLAPGAIYVAAPDAWPYAFEPADDYEARLATWVKTHNFPLFADLGPANFRKLGDRRLVVAAVVDPADAEAASGCERVARAAADAAAPDVRARFGFGVLDGAKWAEYVATFSVARSDLPKILVIDLKREKFYDAFEPPAADAPRALVAHLRAIAAGDVAPRFLGWRGFPDRAARFWVAHSTACTVGLGLLAAGLWAVNGLLADDAPDRAKRD